MLAEPREAPFRKYAKEISEYRLKTAGNIRFFFSMVDETEKME